LIGRKRAEGMVNFARQRNVTRIVVGKPRRALWKSILARQLCLLESLAKQVALALEVEHLTATGVPRWATDIDYKG
jgi:K+-sensing histidine kinase KdpD